MSRKFIGLLLMAALCLPGIGQVRMISHVTRVGGGFTSRILVANNGQREQTLNLTPYAADGSALTPRQVSVASSGVVESTAADLFGGEDVSHFAIEDIDGLRVTVVYDFDGEGSPAHVPENNQQASVWRIYSGNWSQVFDGLAVVNSGGETTEVWVAQMDNEGTVLSSTRVSEALAPNAKALFVVGSPNGGPFTHAEGVWYELSASQPLAVTSLRGTLADAPVGLLWSNDAEPLNTARSKRDDKGVWFVEDGDLEDIFEFVGYNVAYDRMWQAELFKRVAVGRAAELLGPNLLNSDIVARGMSYNDAELAEEWAKASDETRAMFTGYLRGVNRRIAEVNSDLTLVPFEYRALGMEQVEFWTRKDLLLLTAFEQRSFSMSQFGIRQVNNLNLAQELIDYTGGDLETASRMFEDIRWVDDPGAPTMIPKTPEQLKRWGDRMKNRPLPSWEGADLSKFEGLNEELTRLETMFEENRRILKEIGAEVKMGSYAWAVSGDKTESGKPILFAGPQIGFDAPAPALEGSIDSDVLQVSGMFIPGIPACIIGRTPRHAWSFQVGHAHIWDFYFEDDADIFIDRLEVIKIQGQGDFQLPVLRGKHGPLLSPQLGLSWKYSMWGRELNLSDGILAMARAKNIDEFSDGVANLGLSQHVLYADSDNIAYWMSGRNPVRPDGNWRFPQGFLPALEWDPDVVHPMPHDRNPVQGFYGGWNNRASLDLPDLTGTYHFGPFHRATFIQDYLNSQDKFSFDELSELAYKVATTNNYYNGGDQWPAMEKIGFADIVRDNPTPERMEAVDLLEAWDGHFPVGDTRDERLKTMDVQDAYAIQRQWSFFYLLDVFTDEFPGPVDFDDAAERFGVAMHAVAPDSQFTNFYDWFTNLTDPEAGQTHEAAVINSLDRSLEVLGERPWSGAVGGRFTLDYNHDLLGLVYATPLLNRSTYAQCVEIGPDGVERVDSFFALGQSGTILMDENGLPVTAAGTPFPLVGEPPADDPFWGMAELYDNFVMRSFPLFSER